MSNAGVMLNRLRARPTGSWRRSARCSGRNTEEFYSGKPTTDLAALCRHCPVRAQCLDEAIQNDELGWWGGVSEHARQAIKRGRLRKTCPACGSERMWNETDNASMITCQICMTCKLSWRVRRPGSQTGNGAQACALSA